MHSEQGECKEEARIRYLVRQHYFRNRHLTPVHDADDLFQDAWIYFHSQETVTTSVTQPMEEHSETEATQEVLLRRAVRRAASRAFGKFRKRQDRGTATETALEFDPSDSLPDSSLVIDLRNQIDSLPEEEKTVIKLLRSGYDGTEIAALLGLSPQAVSRRKQKAISRLRRILDQT
ncbi:MAG: RNA polymerase sigma factor [Planctomycetaceae bacterium]